MRIVSLLAALSLLLSCSKGYIPETDPVPEGPEYDYIIDANSTYIAVFGDLQIYTNVPKATAAFQRSIGWIYQQVEYYKNFSCVLHTGDISDNNDPVQWKTFLDCMTPLTAKIPFYSCTGDHDYTWVEGKYIDNRYSTLFNSYVKFPSAVKNAVEFFEQGRMENVFIKNEINGHSLNFLILEFGPRKEVVDWAVEYVSTHPDEKFFVINHEYLEKGGGLRVSNLKCKARIRNSSYTTPTELWNKLIKCNDNIVGVLCGHVGGLYNLTLTENDFGREVPQIEHNIQEAAYQYDNWLMLWKFPKGDDNAYVSIYNTKTRKYWENKEILFSFQYNY